MDDDEWGRLRVYDVVLLQLSGFQKVCHGTGLPLCGLDKANASALRPLSAQVEYKLAWLGSEREC